MPCSHCKASWIIVTRFDSLCETINFVTTATAAPVSLDVKDSVVGKLHCRPHARRSGVSFSIEMTRLAKSANTQYNFATGKSMSKATKPSEFEVTIDRRLADRRPTGKLDTDAAAPANEFKEPRRRKERRRQIDPTTCERDYNRDEIDFMQAFDAYKRSSGRMFPTCSEILEVIRDLGYTKLSDEERQLLASIEAVEAEMVNVM